MKIREQETKKPNARLVTAESSATGVRLMNGAESVNASSLENQGNSQATRGEDEGQGRGKGAGPCITAPSSRQSSVLAAGLDWLQVSCFGYFRREDWGWVSSSLEKARAKAEESNDWVRAWEWRGFPLEVRQSGVRHGGFYARWCCRWAGIQLHVVNDRTSTDTRPSVVVVLTSEVLMSLGDKGAWGRVLGLLEALGFELDRDVVSRVDLAVDLADVDVGPLVEGVWEGRCIARGRKKSYYEEGRRKTGFSIGGGIMLRVYDKLLEAQQRASEAKWSALLERWGKEPTSAARFEFQLRRDALREQFSIQSVEDLWAKMRSLVEWLCDEWFRLTDSVPEHRNHGRCKTLEVWNLVRSKFVEWAGVGSAPISKPVSAAPSQVKLMRTFMGAGKSLLARRWRGPETSETLVERLLELIERESRCLERDVRDRYTKLVTLGHIPIGVT